MNVGALIKEYREANSISLRRFAEEVGCSYEYIRRLESGIPLNNIVLLKKISSVIGIDLMEIKGD